MKIALIINDSFSMWHFRGSLIRYLINNGHFVYTISPYDEYVEKIIKLGAQHIVLPMKRFIDPIDDVKLLVRLYKIFKSYDFDIVHTMTIKPNIYGAISAKIAGVKKNVGLVSGLGFVFSPEKIRIKNIIVLIIVKILYCIGNAFTDRMWFQNDDDMIYFVNNKLISRKKCVVIKSGGINLDEYDEATVDKNELASIRDCYGLEKENFCILMVAARMVWSKGVTEFVGVHDILIKRYPHLRFVLIAPDDPGSPDSVEPEYLKENSSNTLIIINEFRNDIKQFIALSEIILFPSMYREGVPRFLLEALSMGRPIVTTKNVGCKETVDDGLNGYLCEKRDVVSMADKTEEIYLNDDLRNKMRKYSREKAKKLFDEKKIIDRICIELYNIKLKT